MDNPPINVFDAAMMEDLGRLFDELQGAIPGGTGSQRLPQLIGRSRALEMILGCEEFDADLAQQYGYVNRAFDAHELRPFAGPARPADRVFSRAGIAMSKRAVDAAELPAHLGLLEEAHAVDQAMVGSGRPNGASGLSWA